MMYVLSVLNLGRENVNVAETIELIKIIAKVIEDNKEYLTELDTAIGDQDHGINLSKGFNAVVHKLGGDFATPGDVIKTTAMTLISTVGGASGPLYGTLFLKMSGLLTGDTITLDDFCAGYEAGILGVKTRGKSEVGQKTMLDVHVPVLSSLQASSAAGMNAKEAFEQAVQVAKSAYEASKDIAATKGRASYLGERSIGHIDPGSMSSYLMIKATAEYLNR